MRQFLLHLSFVEGKWEGKWLKYDKHDGKKCSHRLKTFLFTSCKNFSTKGTGVVILSMLFAEQLWQSGNCNSLVFMVHLCCHLRLKPHSSIQFSP